MKSNVDFEAGSSSGLLLFPPPLQLLFEVVDLQLDFWPEPAAKNLLFKPVLSASTARLSIVPCSFGLMFFCLADISVKRMLLLDPLGISSLGRLQSFPRSKLAVCSSRATPALSTYFSFEVLIPKLWTDS